MIDTLLTKLSFNKTFAVPSNGDIRSFFASDNRCGIYVLHFEDGDFYVGQSIDIAKRFQQHLARIKFFGSPIRQVSYRLIDRIQLDAIEKATIEEFRQFARSLTAPHKFRMKNIRYNEYERGASPFDIIMPPEDQDDWLEDLDKIDNHGPRYATPDAMALRKQYEAKFRNVYLKMPFHEGVTTILRIYVESSIPAIRQGEAVYWACTCAPAKNLYARINVGWQEVMTVGMGVDDYLWFHFTIAYEHLYLSRALKPLCAFFKALSPLTMFRLYSDKEYTNESAILRTGNLKRKGSPQFHEYHFNVSLLPDVVTYLSDENSVRLTDYGLTPDRITSIQGILNEKFMDMDSLIISNLQYEAGGDDQIRLSVKPQESDLTNFLLDEDFLSGMRHMNLRLMRQGTSQWKENHCMSLADLLVE